MKQITVSESYVRMVDELLNLQQKYFAKSAEARRTKLGSIYQEAKDILRECKELESDLRIATAGILGGIHGSMTAEQALTAMREQLNEDLDQARKEVKNA